MASRGALPEWGAEEVVLGAHLVVLYPWFLPARAMEWHARLFNGHREPALTVYGVGTLAMDFSMDITKARKRLGYVPRQSVEEALDEFVAWHVSCNS